MTVMKILLDMQEAYGGIVKDVATNGNAPRAAEILAIGTMPGGMRSGDPSIGMIVVEETGQTFYCETSLKMFQMAAAAFLAKWGDRTGGETIIIADLPPGRTDA